MSRLFPGIAGLVLAVLLLQLCGCTNDKKQPKHKRQEKIIFCQGGHVALLAQTALERGYFAEEGIEAVIMKLGDGKSAMEAFLSGECEFGIMGDPPIVKQAFVRDDFAIIASLSNSTNSTKILARKDQGIRTGKDLKGKRIGIKKAVSSQTFADLYLKKMGIQPTEVNFLFMELKDMPSALMTGDIDAYSASDMYFQEGKRLLGDRAQALSEPGLYLANTHLVTKKEFLAAKPETAKRIMKAFEKADTNITTQPAEAKKVIAHIFKVSEADAEFILKEENHTLALGRQQLDSLTMHARWMINMGLVEKRPVPDFRRIIDSAPLAAVKPGAVNTGR